MSPLLPDPQILPQPPPTTKAAPRDAPARELRARPGGGRAGDDRRHDALVRLHEQIHRGASRMGGRRAGERWERKRWEQALPAGFTRWGARKMEVTVGVPMIHIHSPWMGLNTTPTCDSWYTIFLDTFFLELRYRATSHRLPDYQVL